MKQRLFFFLFFSVISIAVFAQTENKFKAALLLKFMEHIEWPESQYIDTFKLCIVSDNKASSEILNNMIDVKRIKNKPLKIISIQSITKIPFAQMYYLSFDDKSIIKMIVDRLKGSGTLFVTENSPYEDIKMINIVSLVNKAITFEIRPTNLQNYGLLASPDIIVMGGSEIDLVKLYKETQRNLDIERKRIEIKNAELSRLQKKLETTQKGLDIQNKELEKHNRIIEKQYTILNSQKDSLLIQKNKLENLLEKIKNTEQKVSQSEIQVKNQRILLDKKEKALEAKQLEIDSANDLLSQNRKEIYEKDINLFNQKMILENKNRLLLISGISIFVFLLLALYIFRMYKLNRASGIKLEETNKKIVNQKEEIENTLNKLKITQSQLVNSEKMASLGLLTAGIAHEINNPINYVASGIYSMQLNLTELKTLLEKYEQLDNSRDLSILKDIGDYKKKINYEIVKSEMDDIVDSINSGVSRTIDIIKGLRQFSRVDEDVLKQSNIVDNIESTLILLGHEIKNKVVIHKSYDQVPNIECYPGPLNQVYMNILKNAIDAIEDKGNIYISVKMKDPDTVEIIFKDDGQGISKENLNKIFDPFFTTKEVGKGTGLGLAISFGIILKHEGTIHVNSAPGAGAEFIITIPKNQRNRKNKSEAQTYENNEKNHYIN